MRTKRLTLALLAAVVALAPSGPSSLDDELSRLHVHTALVIPAPGVDSHPLWSPGSDRLAASIAGRWETVDLGHLILQEGKFGEGQRIGMIASTSSISESVSAPPWKSTSRYAQRRIQLRSGLVLELRIGPNEQSTSLIVTRPGTPSEVVWTSERDVCHSLVAALDDKHVAYVCDQNGIFVVRPDDIPAK